MASALDFNCPHIGKDGWGCGAAAGSRCNWEHDDAPAPDVEFHAERVMMVPGEGTYKIPTEIIDRVAVELVG